MRRGDGKTQVRETGEMQRLREERPGEVKQAREDSLLTKLRSPGGLRKRRGKVTTATPCGKHKLPG